MPATAYVGPYLYSHLEDLEDGLLNATGLGADAGSVLNPANMRAGRIPDDGFLLLASVPYDEIGVDRARAELKSRFLSTFAADVIRAEFPHLSEQMTIRTAVLDWRSRTLETIA